MNKNNLIKTIILSDMVAFPDVIFRCEIAQKNSIDAVNSAFKNNEKVFLVTQNSSEKTETKPTINSLGTICSIKGVEQGENFISAIFFGEKLGCINTITQTEPVVLADVSNINCYNNDSPLIDSYVADCRSSLSEFYAIDGNLKEDIFKLIMSAPTASLFSNTVAAVVIKNLDNKLEILNELDMEKQLEKLNVFIKQETDISAVNNRIHKKVRDNMNKNQKDYYLREQMRAIGDELGENDDEYSYFEKRINELDASDEIKEKFTKELNRLKKISVASPDNAVIRNYLEVVLELPWGIKTTDNKDLILAQEILDEDHAGLENVKKRIIEHLAVMQLAGKMSGEIICFVGPPGVGKTSIAKSIARALNRNFVSMSVGGLKDESEIRGHRKTYVGAMTGRVMYNIKLAKSINPVFLIDEIDKMSSDYKGDPSSAMLEVLDPEQNYHFRDNFVEVPFDLSNVMFICTANNMYDIPAPLRDRMEIIELSSYLSSEKFEIAKKYLLNKNIKKHGINANDIVVTDDAITSIVEQYTFEAGVRSLEREIAKVCRKLAVKLINKDYSSLPIVVNESDLQDYLGSPKLIKDSKREYAEVGVVTGLSYSSLGGGTLDIEVNIVEGEGKIQLTGNLGNVMKESAQAALSAVRTIASDYNLDHKLFTENDVHIHVPEGAVKKEGPSAGIALATAILSAFSKIKVDNNLAMTGEITIRGNVLAIGGLKEKLYAAVRAGITKVLVPEQNKNDVKELPKEVVDYLEIIYVKDIKDVLNQALIRD